MAKYKIADLYIEVEPRFEFTKLFMHDYETDSKECDISFKVTDEMLEYEESVALENSSSRYYEPLAILRKICENVISYDGFFLHCSCLKYKDSAYVFLGKSGTGKSTHARLWREHFKDEVVMINDDKPIVREKNGEFIIYGTPWMGKHNLGNNISAPIKGIYVLEQYKTNEIEKITPLEATLTFLNQTIIPDDPDSMKKLLTMLNSLISSVPFYRLRCNISDDAVIKATSVL